VSRMLWVSPVLKYLQISGTKVFKLVVLTYLLRDGVARVEDALGKLWEEVGESDSN
jgi:hypothetical protein